jgi:hypothetical protein
MKPADKVVLIASILVLIGQYGYFWRGWEPAAEVSIATSDKTQVFSLRRDRHIRVNGMHGASVIEISHGRARFAASPCSAKLCIHAGWLERTGETAACVSNGVIVSVTGHDARYDSINF